MKNINECEWPVKVTPLKYQTVFSRSRKKVDFSNDANGYWTTFGLRVKNTWQNRVQDYNFLYRRYKIKP